MPRRIRPSTSSTPTTMLQPATGAPTSRRGPMRGTRPPLMPIPGGPGTLPVAPAVARKRPAQEVRVEVDELLRFGCVDLEVDDEIGHGAPPWLRIRCRVWLTARGPGPGRGFIGRD